MRSTNKMLFLGKCSLHQMTCFPRKQNLIPYCENFDLFAIAYHCFCVPKHKEIHTIMNLLKWLSIRNIHLFSSAYKELSYESQSLFYVSRKEVPQSGQAREKIIYKCNWKKTKGNTSSEILHHTCKMTEHNFWSVIFFAT